MLHNLGIIVIIKYMDPLYLRKLRIERQIPNRPVPPDIQQHPEKEIQQPVKQQEQTSQNYTNADIETISAFV
mgnify:CR=1 FL=1